MPAFVAGVDDALNLVFLVLVFRDIGWAGSSHRLSREAIAIRLYAGDVYNRVYAHGAGKTEFDGISPDQLRDGIRTEPSFRQLPQSPRETEIIGGEPDPISDSICRSV